MKAYRWSDSLAVVIRTSDGARITTGGTCPATQEYSQWRADGNAPALPDCSDDLSLPPLEFKHLKALSEMGMPFAQEFLDAARSSPALVESYLQFKGLL
jgi:hypothetical protein